MKVAIVLVLVACIASSTYAAPAPNAADWEAADAKAREFCSLVDLLVTFIKNLAATSDNPDVVASIGAKVDAAYIEAKAVCDRLLAAIGDQSLTPDGTTAIFTEFKGILGALHADLQPDLAQLSPEAAGQINELFAVGGGAADMVAAELIAFISG